MAGLTSPWADRNKLPILESLLRHGVSATATTRLLELASGSGTHAAYFCSSPAADLVVQATDVDDTALVASVAAKREAELPDDRRWRLLEPRKLDVLTAESSQWIVPASFDAVLAVNLLHISPSEALVGTLEVAARALRAGGQLFFYGPFLVDGKPTTESNAAFDLDLKSRNAEWGLRDFGDVAKEAAKFGFAFTARDDMPSNNFFVVLTKAAEGAVSTDVSAAPAERLSAGPLPGRSLDVTIQYCTGCRWLLRAAWVAQELLTTFESEIGGVTLRPAGSGVFRVFLGDELLHCRKLHGSFPELKELKQLLRDKIAAGRSLGHSDKR